MSIQKVSNNYKGEGPMQRWIRTFSVAVAVIFGFFPLLAQPVKEVSGVLASNQTRIFLKDTLYRISGTYTIEGTLVIEPGTKVEFLPNGRIIVWAGGRLIADGEATATYNPNVIDPLDPSYTQFEDGYADLDYFAYPGVITSSPVNEPTVNISKREDIFNVDLSSTDSRLQNLTVGAAIIYKASRIEFADVDPNLKVTPWSRPGGGSVNVVANRITFEGRPVNSFSREWGHIIVLPGAKAAYFRAVDFKNFRKDTTVDRIPIYQPPTPGVAAQYAAFNKRLLSMTNGAGGALTTFSSRTWLVDCVFENNVARYRGGAVQFLQAPLDDFGPGGTPAVYPAVDLDNLGVGYYPTDALNAVNPNVTDPETGLPVNQQIRAIDLLMSPASEPLTDAQRQAVDDGRLAIYLGRVRQLTFRNNKVLLADVVQVYDQNGVPIGIEDDMDNPATVDPYHDYKNQAFGGAVYIAGRNLIEVSLGNNNGFAPDNDYVIFENNEAINLQPVTPNNGKVTQGAKGGAIYVGDATSVILAGRFKGNAVSTPFNTNPADYAQGGAVYASANSPRVQVRGGINQEIPTLFEDNTAARGGAIYTFLLVPTNPVNLLPSPTIGGSNATAVTRDYGYNIKFLNNEAAYDGGAIYAKKRVRIYGAGGVFGATVNYGANYRVEFKGNKAGFSGGAISIVTFSSLADDDRAVDFTRVIFEDNEVGDTTFLKKYFGEITAGLLAQVRGGGAVYTLNAELKAVRAVEFLRNKAYNGNGGALCIVAPDLDVHRFFLTDFDSVSGNSYTTGGDDVYTYGGSVPADVRSLTRFLENEAIPNMDQMGSGTTQPQSGDVSRYHPGTNIPENGTGLGGAIYIVDHPRASRGDMFVFDRVRFQDNKAYSGAVVYSDIYDLELAFNRCLITGNMATSEVGKDQNVITGPYVNGENEASSDLAGAILYGDVIGPYPNEQYSSLGNAIYDNAARFLIRLPDAPNTKGVLAGTTGIGYGGVNLLQGNYWGETGPDVHTIIVDRNAVQETFFIGGDPDESQLPFVQGGTGKQQGPFESIGKYSYTPIPVSDDFTVSIPEKYLQQGVVYDIFDKGTDIKTADYSKRRLARVEDFAVGIPPHLRTYSSDPNDPNYSEHYAGKVVRRWTRDPFVAESDPNIGALQTEFVGDHPIGYPLFLEAWADYSGAAELNNNDERAFHETVFFVINNNTGDFIRVNLKQVDKTSEVFRGRVEFVPDSADRNNNPFIRRTAEGLANFGSGATLLDYLYRNAHNEDLAVLRGRKYAHSEDYLGGDGFQYSNRPDLPASTNGGENVVYFAGEKYAALPVNIGDEILVVSRTVLWREGVNAAIEKGITFRIAGSTNPPVWTGNIVELQQVTPAELQNLVLLKEDVSYPRPAGSGIGRDSILTATAVDTNKFFDPRWVFFPDQYPALTYEWEVAPGSGLSYWLDADTLFYNVPTYYGANSYLLFKGQPTNPFVVPGGEEVVVRVRNWAPSAEVVDRLKELGLSDEEIAKYIYLYRDYMNATVYDSDNARFLQQDTVNYAWDHTIEYRFRILVIDSIPVFTAVDARCQTNDTLIASVTDSLRFDVDFDTDDEAEDSAAAAQGWDFRYGKVAYGFATVGLRDNPGDTAVGGLAQIRPHWLAPQYLQDESGNPDPYAAAFTEKGVLRARIDSSTARQMLLKPVSQYNNWLYTDTVMTVVVHDGHGGVNMITKPILINFSPLIVTDQVAVAVEDQEYNVQLFDTTRVIKVYDPNFDQRHTFELLYEPTTGILRDPCYPEAGNWDEITSRAKTPRWLKIDPETGRLYGIPRVEDAPRLGANADTITVLVTDEYGLTHVKQIPIEVQMVNHPPTLYRDPLIECVDVGEQYQEEITLADLDLKRTFPDDAIEEITLSVTQPDGFTVEPSTVQGSGVDTVTVVVKGTVDNNTPRNPDGTVTIVIQAVDKDGETATLTYRIAVSEETDFVSTIRVENTAGAYQILEWGTAINATTGKDEDLGGIGKLDSNYCEFEIPPIPPANIFDARWMIPERTGILRNIVPKASDRPLEAGFQAGYGDQSGALYPVTISWDKNTVPSPFPGIDWYMRDANSKGNVFYINMRTGHYRASAGVDIVDDNGQVTITVFDTKITGFEIVKDSATAVGVPEVSSVAGVRVNAYPNPVSERATVVVALEHPAALSVEVVDVMGQVVKVLASGKATAGVQRYEWNGMNSAGQKVAAGLYFYRVVVDGKTVMYPVTVVR